MDNLVNEAQKSATHEGSHLPMQTMFENRQSEMLWLRLAGLVKGRQRMDCLERALQINPHNKQTLRLMQRLDPKRACRTR